MRISWLCISCHAWKGHTYNLHLRLRLLRKGKNGHFSTFWTKTYLVELGSMCSSLNVLVESVDGLNSTEVFSNRCCPKYLQLGWGHFSGRKHIIVKIMSTWWLFSSIHFIVHTNLLLKLSSDSWSSSCSEKEFWWLSTGSPNSFRDNALQLSDDGATLIIMFSSLSTIASKFLHRISIRMFCFCNAFKCASKVGLRISVLLFADDIVYFIGAGRWYFHFITFEKKIFVHCAFPYAISVCFIALPHPIIIYCTCTIFHKLYRWRHSCNQHFLFDFFRYVLFKSSTFLFPISIFCWFIYFYFFDRGLRINTLHSMDFSFLIIYYHIRIFTFLVGIQYLLLCALHAFVYRLVRN